MFRASFCLLLLVLSPLTEGQFMRDECHEGQIMECITKKFMGVGMYFALPQANPDNIYKAICSANIKECTFGNARQNCPKDKRMELELAEASMVAGFDALCENEGSLLKTLLDTYQCWNIPEFVNCIQQLALTTKGFDFFAKRTEKDLEVLKNELPKCVARSKINSPRCAQVDIGSIEKLVHTFLGRTVQGYDVPSQASLSAAAPLSIALALVLTRWN